MFIVSTGLIHILKISYLSFSKIEIFHERPLFFRPLFFGIKSN